MKFLENTLHGDEADIETITYFQDLDHPPIVFGIGLGGSADEGFNSNLVRSLVMKDYKVNMNNKQTVFCSQ